MRNAAPWKSGASAPRKVQRMSGFSRRRISVQPIPTGLSLADVTFARIRHLIDSATGPKVTTRGAGAKSKMQKATFAAGCFWGVEATFRQMPGVLATRVGYIGGNTANPTYKEVCTDRTGHAEAVEIDYDPAQIRYSDLLKVFWENHDPTQLNRQGPDWGTQYRSAIFFHTPEQQAEAQASKESLEKAHRCSKPIVTQIVPAVTFYPAEDYHQQYLEKRGLATCHIKA